MQHLGISKVKHDIYTIIIYNLYMRSPQRFAEKNESPVSFSPPKLDENSRPFHHFYTAYGHWIWKHLVS